MTVLVSFNFNQDLLTQFDEEEVLVIFDDRSWIYTYVRKKIRKLAFVNLVS